jgi:hypothetical protein
MKIKHPKFFWIVNGIILLFILAVWLVDPLHATVQRWLHEGYAFVKAYVMSLFAALFLVKGKFVFNVFLKRIFFMSATGLTKRYMIEKVLTYHIKEHFIRYIRRDLKRLFEFIKRNFMRFSLGRKIVAGVALLGSLGYVSKFMGTMIAFKVFVAKIWSFLLALVLKAANWFVYFFTDYVWGSWLGPIVEVVVFSWMMSWLEKIPFLKRFFDRLYYVFERAVAVFNFVTERLFHLPLRKGFRWLVRHTKRLIYKFIGYKRLSAYYQLQELRRFNPSIYEKLKRARKSRYIVLKEKKQNYAKRRNGRISRYAKRFNKSGSL